MQSLIVLKLEVDTVISYFKRWAMEGRIQPLRKRPHWSGIRILFLRGPSMMETSLYKFAHFLTAPFYHNVVFHLPLLPFQPAAVSGLLLDRFAFCNVTSPAALQSVPSEWKSPRTVAKLDMNTLPLLSISHFIVICWGLRFAASQQRHSDLYKSLRFTEIGTYIFKLLPIGRLMAVINLLRWARITCRPTQFRVWIYLRRCLVYKTHSCDTIKYIQTNGLYCTIHFTLEYIVVWRLSSVNWRRFFW